MKNTNKMYLFPTNIFMISLDLFISSREQANNVKNIQKNMHTSTIWRLLRWQRKRKNKKNAFIRTKVSN